MFKISSIAFLFLVICIGCGNSMPEKLEKEQLNQNDETEYISILNEIPDYIQEVENLTTFQGDLEATHTIELIPEQVFGEDKESNFFLINKSVEDDKGRLIIWGVDSNRGEGVYVYNADGTYNTQLGGEGKGPGEYGIILDIDAKAGKVFVSDYTSLRLNEYSTNGYSIERSIQFEEWDVDSEFNFKRYVIPRNDGNYLLAYSDKNQRLGQLELIFKVMDSEGNSVSNRSVVIPSGFAIDTGSKSRISKPSLSLDFMGNTVTYLSNENIFYTVSTKDLLVKKYNADGIYQSAFYYPVVGPPFDLDRYLKKKPFTSNASQIKSAIDEMNEELPKTTPIINQVIVDDENRIWIPILADPGDKSYEWWILRESGELIAKLSLPRTQRIFDIKKGHVYARKDNGKEYGYLYSGDGSEEADAEYVVKYRIKLAEKTATSVSINIPK